METNKSYKDQISKFDEKKASVETMSNAYKNCLGIQHGIKKTSEEYKILEKFKAKLIKEIRSRNETK